MSQTGVCCARSHGAEISGSSNPVDHQIQWPVSWKILMIVLIMMIHPYI